MSNSTIPPTTNQQQAQQSWGQGQQQQGGQGQGRALASSLGGQNIPPSNAPPAQQGLPQTGLQQQLASLNQFYGRVENASTMNAAGKTLAHGFDPREFQFRGAQLGGTGSLGEGRPMGSSSLNQMARNLAQRYGLPIGRGRLIDDDGNWLIQPDQLSDASGGRITQGEAAAKMNYIEQALNRKKNEGQQQQAMAAMQTGIGMVQSNAPGSLATLMQGSYQGMADLLANKEYEAYDFSYFIEQERLDIAAELERQRNKRIKKTARGQFVAGVGVTIVGLYSGNYMAVGKGMEMAGSSYGETGWF